MTDYDSMRLTVPCPDIVGVDRHRTIDNARRFMTPALGKELSDEEVLRVAIEHDLKYEHIHAEEVVYNIRLQGGVGIEAMRKAIEDGGGDVDAG